MQNPQPNPQQNQIESASEKRYRRLFEASPDGILLLDARSQTITDANPFMAQLSGMSREDFLGKELWEIGLFADSQASESAFQTLREAGILRFEVTLKTATGAHHNLEIVANWSEEDGPLVQCNLRDITQRKCQQGEQAQSAAIVESSTNAIFSVDLAGAITTWNRGAQQLYGYAPDEAIGRFLALIFAPDHAEQADFVLEHIQRGEAMPNFEMIPARKAENATTPENAIGKRRRFPRRDEDLSLVSLSISPLYDACGTLLGASVIARDITEQKRAREASQRNGELYRALTANFPNGAVYLLDLEGRFFLAEGRGMAAVGLSPEDFLGKTLHEVLLDSSNHDNIRLVFEQALQGQETVTEIELNGRFRSVRGVPVRDDRGEISFILAMTQDVTERKQAEQALTESEARMRALVQSIEEVVFEFDANGIYLNVWTNDENLLVRPKVELIGQRLADVVGLAMAQPLLESFERIFAGGPAEDLEHSLEVDAEKLWFLARLSPIVSADGSIKSICVLMRNITEKKRTQQALEQTNREILATWESMSDAFYAVDNEWNVTRMNAQAAVLLKQNLEELIGKNLWAQFPTAVNMSFYAEFQRAMREQVPVVFEEYLVSLDMWTETRVYPSEMGLSIYFRDITGRKRDEQALRASEARFQSIVANVPGMVYQFILHPDGSFEFPFVSEGCRELSGLEVKEIQEDPQLLVDILQLADRPAFERSVAESATTVQPWAWESSGQLGSGKIKWVQGFARPQRMINGSTLWDGLLVDITARKEAEEERDRFFALSPDLLGIGSADGYFKRINPAFETVLGYSTAEMLSRPFMEFAHPDDWAATLVEVEKLHTGTPMINFVNRYICQDGSIKWLSWHVVPFKDLFYIAAHDVTALIQTKTALRQVNEELESRVVRRTAELAKANQGLQVEIVERQVALAALREASEALHQSKEEAERANGAKSEFLSRMSHELRTPLNAILGFGEILQGGSLSQMEKEHVNQILQGGWHLLDLINEVLDIARVESGYLDLTLEEVSLFDLVMESCALVRPLAAQRNVRLDERDVTCENCRVVADRQRLKQVLINLLSNGIKYNQSGGKMSIFCQTMPEGRLRIGVRDTGKGISPQDVSKLFVPFERLNAADSGIEGTGLGLVLSSRLVSAMDGTLEVESTIGQGSTFWIDLPQAGASGTVTKNPATDAMGNAQTALIIESDQPNLRLLEAILVERPQINLMSALRGDTGLELIKKRNPDLILLELTLRDMPGAEVLHQLQQSEETRDIPVIIISADATSSEINQLLNSGAKAYLPKPLDVTNLLRSIDETLRSKVALQIGAKSMGNDSFITAPIPDTSVVESPSPVRSLRVLVAEDNLVNQKVVRHQLQNLGHQSTILDNGYDIVQAWHEGDFDLILMDCHMPKLDGYATTREIRHLETRCNAEIGEEKGGKDHHIPIIALTANASADDREKSLASGMDDHLSKPIKQAELAAALGSWASDSPLQDSSASAATKYDFIGESVLQKERWNDLQQEVDTELLSDLVQLFLEEAPQLLEALQEAVSCKNALNAQEIAHKLKGSCGIMGVARMATLCQGIENQAKAGDMKAIMSHLERLRREFAAAQTELQTYLTQH